VQDAHLAATAVLRLHDLRHSFRQGGRTIDVLAGASTVLQPGQAVALVGPSGAGKSTLLHVAGLLETPQSGRVFVNGRDCSKMNDDERTRVRRAEMGFVYQFHQLLPEFSAIENVMMPQLIQGRRKSDAFARAKQLLDALGLGQRIDHRPSQLSGGEQQRTAIARALANAPKLLFADEPTGNLDPQTSEQVFEDLLALVERTAVAALIATHNLELARRMHRVLRMEDGRLIEVSSASVR
jgi:lipoprotein-releasing system ATP-binding protein